MQLDVMTQLHHHQARSADLVGVTYVATNSSSMFDSCVAVVSFAQNDISSVLDAYLQRLVALQDENRALREELARKNTLY